MASFEASDVLKSRLSSLDDDILEYLISVVDSMENDERKSGQALYEAIGPFLLDCGFADSEEAAQAHCKAISIEFGGSGFKTATSGEVEDAPLTLLAAPVKIKDSVGLNKPPKSTYGGTVISSFDSDGQLNDVNHNSTLDLAAIPANQKQLRKMRKENERLQRLLRAEELARYQAEAEMSAARMAAIKANRSSGRQAAMGVKIERFSIPHPNGTGELLSDASLVLAQNRRYGLIGKNGAGKSTLMRRIAGYKIPGLMHLRILLVDQHVEGDDLSALEWVLRADVERTSLLEDEQRLLACQHGTADMSSLPADLQGVNLEVALAECYDRMEVIGVSTAEQRARKILTGLGFTEDMMTHPTGALSGGWAMRAALAAALYISPDLLLLDEPTNHLDLHALVWLEQWLTTKFGGILLVVSHDEVFLDAVCTDILELKSTLAGQSKSALTHFSGDYGTYTNTVLEHRIAQARQRAAYEKERDKLKEFIAREGKKYDNPQHQAQRKMKMKQLQNLEVVEQLEEDKELVLRFPKPYGSFRENETLIAVNGASFGWEATEGSSVPSSLLFEEIDMTIGPKARIAILGKNGCGKTSLLNLLVGDTTPTNGTVKRHLGCRIARLHQHHYKGEQLDPDLTPLDHMRRLPQEEAMTALNEHDLETRHRAFMANFGISWNFAVLPVRYLSGGQRMRIALAIALFCKPDLLILDEPTNHLDADTVRALCESLSTFEGAIIAVSHDEAFVNKVINGIGVVDQEGSDGKSGSILKDTYKDTNTGLPKGELWVMSKRRLQRFDGEFREYKKIIRRKVEQGLDF